jgi:hypothetical protein
MVKVAHLLNAVLQWIWLNEFLRSTRYPYWGFQILRDLYIGYDWQATGHFPRVTHCDFSQRKASSFNVSCCCFFLLRIKSAKIFVAGIRTVCSHAECLL